MATKVGSLLDVMSKTWDFSCMFRVDKMTPVTNTGQTIATPIINRLDHMDIVITGVDVHPITHAPIESYVSNKWVYTNGRREILQVDITFRDLDGLSLYNGFKSTYNTLRGEFPEDQYWTLQVATIPNFDYSTTQTADQARDYTDHTYIVNTSEAIISNIGSISLDSSSKDIVTFTVSFMYAIK